MAYITNGQLAEQFGTENLQNFLENLMIVKALNDKYGKKLLMSTSLDAVEKENSDVCRLIKILDKLGKLNDKDIKSIIKIIRLKSDGYIHEFHLKTGSNKVYTEINNYLSSKFSNSNVEMEHCEDIGIDVRGDGFYYKRTLENDLNKLI